MAQKVRSSFVLVALGLLVASCASSGSIESGQNFGVHVGMPLNDAGAILRRQGLEPVPPGIYEPEARCGMRAAGHGEEISAFTSPLKPIVCLFVVSGRVVAIAWEY